MELYFIILFCIIVLVVILFKLLKYSGNKLNKKEYLNYVKFLGDLQPNDNNYNEKINKIKSLINNNQMTDINEIAKLSGCSYHECILKIKFLKNQGIIENYYVDEQNGIINKCSESDRKLITTYAPYIYTKQLQLDQITKLLPQTTYDNFEIIRKTVLNDLSYLDGKNLLNGINIDLVDEKIIYYKKTKNNNQKDIISLECEKCGALNEVPRNGKVRCEYCEAIIEDKSINN